MFEREIRDAAFIKRWGITRNIREQYVDAHSFYVATYANDLCILLEVDKETHLATLQASLWHDMCDEIFTGDMPGPQKRAMVKDRTFMKTKLHEWTTKVFGPLYVRSGLYLPSDKHNKSRAIMKAADLIDAHFYCCGELQMGNKNMEIRVARTRKEAENEIEFMMSVVRPGDKELEEKLVNMFLQASDFHLNHFSMGPEIGYE